MSAATSETPALLLPAEAARLLRVTRATVYRLVERGDLRAVRIGDGPSARLRIGRDELDRLLNPPGRSLMGSPSPARRRSIRTRATAPLPNVYPLVRRPAAPAQAART